MGTEGAPSVFVFSVAGSGTDPGPFHPPPGLGKGPWVPSFGRNTGSGLPKPPFPPSRDSLRSSHCSPPHPPSRPGSSITSQAHHCRSPEGGTSAHLCAPPPPAPRGQGPLGAQPLLTAWGCQMQPELLCPVLTPPVPSHGAQLPWQEVGKELIRAF